MSNLLYPLTKQVLETPSALGTTSATDVNLATDNIKVALVRGYTYASTHAFLSDITGAGAGSIVATSANLASKTTTNGIFNAANITFTAVSAGAACQNLIIYKDSGTSSTSCLIASIDTATGLPVTPSGGDIVVNWDTGSNKIFAL